ncbi:MAG: sulfite exporter TauE/SafE family protein, partial [Pseudomonadota bacterium]|nr:sulfite exporter TauE/SafE family protein [Pseudomonadota bacterium]
MNTLSLQALLPSLDPLLIASICGIFVFAGIVKGFLGIGLPAAAMGLLTLIFPPTEAISLLWLPILFSNMFQFGR